MLKLFEVCFYTGILFTVVSFLLTEVLDVFNIDFELDMDLDFDGDIFGTGFWALKPTIIISFITTFGGVGIIFTNKGFNLLITLGIAISIAVMVSTLLQKFIIAPLYRAQNTSTVSQEALIGLIGKAKINIIGNSFGSISYGVNGNIYSAPAKSIDGKDIYKGETIKIVNIDNNTFYVIRA